MREKATVILCLTLFFGICSFAAPLQSSSIIQTNVVTISVEQQYEFVRPGSESALAVHFELKEDWHFYASAESAPGGMNLKVKPLAENSISFSQAIFPPSQLYFDKFSGKRLEVFSDEFTVFLPFSVSSFLPGDAEIDVRIDIEGAVCSDVQCRVPDFGQLSATIKFAGAMGEPKFTLPVEEPFGKPSETITFGSGVSSVWGALVLAFLAGLILNIMPCVLPVIPLKVLSIFEQARQSKRRCVAMGLSFCFGILLFFAALAVLNVVLRLGYGRVLQWGDHFRSPAFIVGMSLLMVVLALFMFGVFTITVPSVIAGRSGSGKGYSGSVGMGFLAAILSTPCSFAILTAAFAWAQTQKLVLATVAIMTIGVGMATPYVVLTSMPSLLKHLPRPGRWTELFKQTMGFVLLAVAVWLVSVLPEAKKTAVLYFAVVLGFSAWMWGGWVSYSTKPLRKWLIRIIAIVLAVAAGWVFLPEPAGELIDWQKYDADLIEDALTVERPVLIKFTAEWCLTCKVVEKTVYTRENITELIKQKGVLAIKADTTLADNPATIALKQVYNEPGVPVSILFVPGQNDPMRLHGLMIGDELKRLLEKLPDKN